MREFVFRGSETTCQAKYVDGLLQRTGENYEWPIDELKNASKGSLGHPEVAQTHFWRWYSGTQIVADNDSKSRLRRMAL